VTIEEKLGQEVGSCRPQCLERTDLDRRCLVVDGLPAGAGLPGHPDAADEAVVLKRPEVPVDLGDETGAADDVMSAAAFDEPKLVVRPRVVVTAMAGHFDVMPWHLLGEVAGGRCTVGAQDSDKRIAQR
jgi:hypothetical protein